MRNLVHSTAWVAYSVAYSSVSNLIVKHWHGLVTDCHRLLIVPIVPQSAPIVSVADVSVKLYRRQLQVKDLPKVPTWRLKRDSNPRPFKQKASNLPRSITCPTSFEDQLTNVSRNS